MIAKKISGEGYFPSICWDAAEGCVRVAWQVSRTVGVAELDPNTLSVLHVQSWDVKGGEAVYPELGFHDGRCYVAWRDGAPPYAGHLRDLVSNAQQDMEPFHGARPCVFGAGFFAWINNGSAAGWPTQAGRLVPDQRVTGTLTRSAAGTGLSHIDPVGSWCHVTTIDEARNAFAGMTDPSWVSTCVVGATDIDGQPTLRARLFSNSFECLIAKGQVSKDPRICTDGRSWYIVAWSEHTSEGVRVWKLTEQDFKSTQQDYPRSPNELSTPDRPLYIGSYHTNSKYGEYYPEQNCPMLGIGLYTDGEGNTPQDADAKVSDALSNNDHCWLAADERSIRACADQWSKVAGLILGELDSPEQVREQCAAAHNLLAELNLPDRPVVSTLTVKQTTDPAYNGTADIAGVELYFDAPPQTYTAMEQQVYDRVDHVLRAHSGRVLFIVQSYDRSKPALWTDGFLEAIQFAAHEAMCAADGRVVGCLWFSYARPTGVLDHPALEQWHDEASGLTQSPEPIDDDEDPMPEAKVYYPADDQMINSMQRIADAYVNVLKRVPPPEEQPPAGDGIFRVPPDGMSVAIPDHTRANTRIDTKSISVWLGRYFNYFQQYKGDHERSINQVLTDIRNSPEGQAANPQ